jgi:hypothetical protein
MSTVKSQQVSVFYGTPTTPAERKMLHDAGFVHVTGLTVQPPHNAESYVIGERLTPANHGKWDQNNSKIVVVTTGGEVWLRAGGAEGPACVEEVKKQLAPNGRGAFVPLSNGETVEQYHLFCRVADPNHGFVVQAG